MRLVAAITPVAVRPSATDAGPISAEKGFLTDHVSQRRRSQAVSKRARPL